MLTSITSLGERSRHQRWGVTAAALVAGSTLAGGVVGAALGAFGGLLLPSASTTSIFWLASAVLGLGALAEAARDRVPLPSLHRQVNEDWLPRYRGWVYGAGFGLQLGAGMLTIVTSWSVYVTLSLCVIAGSAEAGAAIGGTFGLARAAAALPGGLVRSPRDLVALSEWVERHRRLAWIGSCFALAAMAAAGILASLGVIATGRQG